MKTLMVRVLFLFAFLFIGACGPTYLYGATTPAEIIQNDAEDSSTYNSNSVALMGAEDFWPASPITVVGNLETVGLFPHCPVDRPLYYRVDDCQEDFKLQRGYCTAFDEAPPEGICDKKQVPFITAANCLGCILPGISRTGWWWGVQIPSDVPRWHRSDGYVFVAPDKFLCPLGAYPYASGLTRDCIWDLSKCETGFVWGAPGGENPSWRSCRELNGRGSTEKKRASPEITIQCHSSVPNYNEETGRCEKCPKGMHYLGGDFCLCSTDEMSWEGSVCMDIRFRILNERVFTQKIFKPTCEKAGKVFLRWQFDNRCLSVDELPKDLLPHRQSTFPICPAGLVPHSHGICVEEGTRNEGYVWVNGAWKSCGAEEMEKKIMMMVE